MTISIWRYSHLALAVSSFLFLALASVTGIILAFEPIIESEKPYRTDVFSNISVADFVTAQKKSDIEIVSFSVENNQFVIVKAIDGNGKNIAFYADAKTGKSLGEIKEKSAFFEWMKNLHRSLFLHNTGRIFMGITAFLLLLIALSGTVLIIQRQRGIKRFFTKIVKEDFAQYYHVILGRLSLVVILIIAVTGTYLSLVRFEIFTDKKIAHKIDFDAIESEPKKEIAQFSVFKNTLLCETKSLEFPFSDDPEDYYTLKTHSGEFVVNQFTGGILSEIQYSNTKIFSELSLDLHTGRTNWFWALILAIASGNILFFIYSGFAMTLKRRKSKIKNRFKKDEAEIILLIGSENGTTLQYADAIHQQLLKIGKKSFIAELNTYTIYSEAKHFVILTSTYGLGNPPANAGKFLSLLEKYPQRQKIKFSVVGFGSHAYPDFCRFAIDVNQQLSLQDWAEQLLEIHTVNDKSSDEFAKWAKLWSEKSETGIPVPTGILGQSKKLQSFKVIEKTALSHEGGAFLMKLRPKKGNFTSGDLLNIYPANDHRERQYSIGKIGKDIQIAVKLHPNGFGSNYLFSLDPGDVIRASISKNPDFHLPKIKTRVIMISNGTGIAPFLGMIDQAERNRPEIQLYCGFRDKSSYSIYKDYLEKHRDFHKLSLLKIAYSREGNKEYVKDILARDADSLASSLRNGEVIMICGSLAMLQNILELLEEVCKKPVAYYQSRNQILSDCY